MIIFFFSLWYVTFFLVYKISFNIKVLHKGEDVAKSSVG